MIRSSHFILVLLSLAMTQRGLAAQHDLEPEIIVKEVILPVANADWETHWFGYQSVVDPSSLSTSALVGRRYLSSHQGWASNALWGLRDRSRSTLSENPEPDFVGLGYYPTLALVGTPHGTELWTLTRDAAPNLAVFDVETTTFVRELDVHDLPGHQESSIWHLRYAGDLNGDGWGDVFMACQSLGESNSFYLCVDGKSGAAHWVYETGRTNADPLPTIQLVPGLPPDLDSDGVPDFLVRDFFVHNGTTLRTEVMAISGASGTLIWDHHLDWVPYLPEITVTHDLNGDGVSDVLIHGGSSTTPLPHAEARSGQDGSLIWESDFAGVEAALAPDTVLAASTRTIVNPAPDGGGLRIAMSVRTISAATGLDSAQVAFVDASNGAYLSHTTPPTSLKPFHHEPFSQDWIPSNFPAGDYDGDGLHETMEVVNLYSEDTSASPDIPGALVIFGQRTLYGSGTVTSGSAMDLQIRIPTMPLQSFQLLASTKLSQRLSPSLYVHGGMPTLLGHSLLLSRTASHPTLSGTLDILGAADLTVQIPSASALIGSTIYSRAAILDPVYPGEVMTQSTILATQVR